MHFFLSKVNINGIVDFIQTTNIALPFDRNPCPAIIVFAPPPVFHIPHYLRRLVFYREQGYELSKNRKDTRLL